MFHSSGFVKNSLKRILFSAKQLFLRSTDNCLKFFNRIIKKPFSAISFQSSAFYHLSNALAQVNPLPNAARHTRSPSFILPSCQASHKAMGIEAAVVLP